MHPADSHDVIRVSDRLHRGVRVGQELAGVRHHRGRVAAAHQRDVQQLRAGVHAHTLPPRRRRARGPHHRDHRRPGAHGRDCAVHGLHREAIDYFGGAARIPQAHSIVTRMADVGLGYLTLGQPLTTLSGGERQRLKLAIEMAEKGGIYVLDEPTSGLHLADVEQLLRLLDRLVDSGKSVIVIEHHQAVMAHADWIIDLGPGAGHDGGLVVFEGTPARLVADRSTLTGQHLAEYVGADARPVAALRG